MPSALLVVVKNGLLFPGTGALLACVRFRLEHHLYAECLHVPGADSFLEEPGRVVDHCGIALLLRVLTQDS